MANPEFKKVSKRYAQSEFSLIGKVLILYSLLVLYFPIFFRSFIEYADRSFIDDQFLFFGVFYIILLVGTFLPFGLLQSAQKIRTRKLYRITDASLVDVVLNTLVVFTTCSFFTFAVNIFCSYLGIQGTLISNIGYNINAEYLKNGIYIFMFIILSPILEEYAFRGVLLNSFNRYGKRFGLYASSLMFALAHHSLQHMVVAFVMGIMLGRMSLRYKSVIPSTFTHIFFNLILYLLFITPDRYSLYITILMAFIYIITIVLVAISGYTLSAKKRKKPDFYITEVFVGRPETIAAFILFLLAGLFYHFM